MDYLCHRMGNSEGWLQNTRNTLASIISCSKTFIMNDQIWCRIIFFNQGLNFGISKLIEVRNCVTQSIKTIWNTLLIGNDIILPAIFILLDFIILRSSVFACYGLMKVKQQTVNSVNELQILSWVATVFVHC